ncbi:MAG TPA: stage II sporulation protein M [Candidatus Bathyarchaeia archaeon]|nr:stage II sporulation protein M [Candidatus Bathyarchaeia archaeon]
MGDASSFRVKRVFFDRIFEKSFWTWRKHPAIIVPTMLGSALQLILQSIVVLALMLLLTSWAVTGSLSRFLAEYGNTGLSSLFVDPAFSASLISVVTMVVVGLVFVALIGGGYIYSSEYGMYLEALSKDSVPLRSVLENGSRRWKPMAWTLLLSNVITWGPAAVGYLVVSSSAASANSLEGLLATLIASFIFLPLFFASLVLALFTIFSYPAVVVDQLSGLRAIRQSFRVASHNLGITLTYSVVRIIFQVLLLLVVAFASVIGLPLTSLITLVLSFVLTPILHMTKAWIYYYATPAVPEMPFQVADPIWQDVFHRLPRAAWLKIKIGLSEGFRFVTGPRNLPFHLFSALAFALGIYMGYFVSVNGVAGYFLSQGYQPGHGNSLLARLPVPALPALGVDIFLNNWLVSIATGLSGLAFGAPSFITIMFNGFILGVLLAPQLSPSMTMFFAAILPHGIIEIPSFVLAGSVGLRLGYAALKAKFQRGPENDEYLSKTLRLAVYVVVGLAPLFLVAGLIEADITPRIMQMFGWTF